ncbi:MAG TPA: homoserine dehydrogenase [Tepidisphaeraceae bacterium]|nr:homoserine dehydrogenase [Tepidisphaeraceae bacterium]
MTESPIGISLLGCGVVGSGVVRLLTEQRELLERRTGLRFDLRHVVVRDPHKHKSNPQHRGLPLTGDANAAIDDPKVSIVVETVGGTTTAAEYVERALKLGKPVVTANKSLLAARGPELFTLARKHNACIAFEASAGGGIPIIDAMSRGLIANRIDALVGILNGTCNVILTRMTRNGWTYAQALAEAQKLGFAEADPTLDVSGRDTAQKLALLAGLAFNVRVAESDIHVEGIDTLQPTDIAFAKELGYVIKLLAIADRGPDGRLGLRVHPTLVHTDDVMAEVSGGFNAISVYGHALGHALFYGRGAGQMPTASAVVADLVSVAMGTTALMFKRLRIFPDAVQPATTLPMEQTQARYYLRLTCRDQPGVMGQVSQILGHHGISLSAILQRETTEDGQFVPVVITTHRAAEGPMRESLKALDRLPSVMPPTVCLRIIDQPKEFAAS